jgi:hypothetical protein
MKLIWPRGCSTGIHSRKVSTLTVTKSHIGRYNEIETENKKLLHKLSDIMRTSTNALSPRKPPQETIFRKSLNRDSRRRELVKITMEN